jgi:hypothetical protein
VGSKTAFGTQSRIHNSVVTECYKKQVTKLQNWQKYNYLYPFFWTLDQWRVSRLWRVIDSSKGHNSYIKIAVGYLETMSTLWVE